MKIGFNCEIITSNDLDNMSIDELREYFSIMDYYLNMFSIECNYCKDRIAELKESNNVDFPLPF